MFALVVKNTAIWILGGTVLCVLVGLAVGTFLAVDSWMTTLLRALILLPWVLILPMLATQWLKPRRHSAPLARLMS